MATRDIYSTVTLSQMLKSGAFEGDKKTKAVVNFFDLETGFIANVPNIRANGVMSHTYARKLALPLATSTRAGGYATPSATQTDQGIAEIAVIKSPVIITRDELGIGGSIARQKMAEAGSDAAMSIDNEADRQTVYGDAGSPIATNANEFDGLAKQYASATTSPTKANIISATSIAGQTDCSSMYFVGIGGTGLSYAYPSTSDSMGIMFSDPVTYGADDGAGKKRVEVMYEFSVARGLVLPDWRQVVRIMNIDTSVLLADKTGATIDMLSLTLQAIMKVPRKSPGVTYKWVVNRKVFAGLAVQMQGKNTALTFEQIGQDKRSIMLHGFEVVLSDAILSTETYVA